MSEAEGAIEAATPSGTIYLDTSALGRLLLSEPDAEAIRTELSRWEHHASSRLMAVELRRLGIRRGIAAAADQLLAGVALLPVDAALLVAAESITPPTVATLDAIHLATALQLRDAGLLDAAMTYDRQLSAGLDHHEIEVLAPEQARAGEEPNNS